MGGWCLELRRLELYLAQPEKKSTVSRDIPFITEMGLFNILDKLHHTAEGADGIPAWYLRLAAPAYSGVLAHLINLSVSSSIVPKQWKVLSSIQWLKYHYLPLLLTFAPYLLLQFCVELTEREIVRRYMYPAFEDNATSNLLKDQYAFRPTGSTTSALISIQQQTSQMLEDNEYVAIVSLDLAKAFDTVSHDTLAKKLAAIAIPDRIYNWVVDFL